MKALNKIIHCVKRIISYYKLIVFNLNFTVFNTILLTLFSLICLVIFIIIKYIGCYFKIILFISVILFIIINISDLFYINKSFIELKNKILENDSLWDFYYEKNLPYRLKEFYFDIKYLKAKYLWFIILIPFFIFLFLLERAIRLITFLILISSILTAILSKQDKEYTLFLEEDIIKSFEDLVLIFFTMSANSCFIRIYSIKSKKKLNIKYLIENLVFNKSIGKSKFFINSFIYFIKFLVENAEIIKNSTKKKNYQNIKWLTLQNLNFFLSKYYVKNIIPFWTCKIMVVNSKIIINMKNVVIGIMHHSKEIWNRKEQTSLLKAKIMVGNIAHDGKVILPEKEKITQAWTYTSKPYFQVKKLFLSSFFNSLNLGEKKYETLQSIDDYKYEVYLEENIRSYQFLIPSYVQDEQIKLSPMSLQHTLLHRAASEKMKILSAIKRIKSEITLEENPDAKVEKIMNEIDKYPDIILENSIKIKEINNKFNIEKNDLIKENLMKEKKACANLINHTLTKWNHVKELIIVQGRYPQLSTLENKEKLKNVSIYVKDYEKKTAEYYKIIKEMLEKDAEYNNVNLVNKHRYLSKIENHYQNIGIRVFREILEGGVEVENEYTKDLPQGW